MKIGFRYSVLMPQCFSLGWLPYPRLKHWGIVSRSSSSVVPRQGHERLACTLACNLSP